MPRGFLPQWNTKNAGIRAYRFFFASLAFFCGRSGPGFARKANRIAPQARHYNAFIIQHSAFIISLEEGHIVNIAPHGGNKSQNVTECNGECNGSKMRKCLGFNVCNGVTAVSEQWSGTDPAPLPAVVLAAEIR
jgi:hypothetical protein